MAKAISGKKAAVFISTSTPVQFGPQLLTWNSARTEASASTQFWHDSDTYPVTVIANGVLTGGIIAESSNTNEVTVTATTAYQGGTSVTVAAGSVTSLTKATTGGNRIVYAIIITTAGAFGSVAGTSGTATTTAGAAGGPPYVSAGAVILGYVTRLDTATTTITEGEITLSSFGGQERALNPSPIEIHPLSGKLVFATAANAQHTGGTAKRVYVKAYEQNATMQKVGQIIDWSLGVTREREDTTCQNDDAMKSDPGRKSYSFSGNKFIAEIADDLFDHVNDTGTDFIVKLYHNQYDTSDYYVAQMGLDLSHDFPNNDKIKQGITGQITGHVEKI